MSGPAGCGKAAIVRSVASQLNMHVLSVSDVAMAMPFSSVMFYFNMFYLALCFRLGFLPVLTIRMFTASCLVIVVIMISFKVFQLKIYTAIGIHFTFQLIVH